MADKTALEELQERAEAIKAKASGSNNEPVAEESAIGDSATGETALEQLKKRADAIKAKASTGGTATGSQESVSNGTALEELRKRAQAIRNKGTVKDKPMMAAPSINHGTPGAASQDQVRSWVDKSMALMKDAESYYDKWSGAEGNRDEEIRKRSVDLMRELSGVKAAYAGNEEAISYIDSITENLMKVYKSTTSAREYYSQWDSQDAYDQAVAEYDLEQQVRNMDVAQVEAEAKELESQLKDLQKQLEAMQYIRNAPASASGAIAQRRAELGTQISQLEEQLQGKKTLLQKAQDMRTAQEQAQLQQEALKLDLEETAREIEILEDARDRALAERQQLRQATSLTPEVKGKIAQLDAQISQMETQLRAKKNLYQTARDVQGQRQRTEDLKQLESVSANADFKDASAYDASYGQDGPNGPAPHTYEAMEYDHINGQVSDVSNRYFKDKYYDQMKPEEVAVYNYYLKTQGTKAARTYLDSLQETLNARYAEDAMKGYKGKTGKEIFFGAKAGWDQAVTGLKNLDRMILSTIKGEEGGYITPTGTQMLGSMIRQDLDKNAGGFATTAYDVINTTANMLPSILTATAVNLVAPGAGSLVGATMMGGGAAGNAYQEALNVGFSQKEAAAYGTAIGISEAALESVLGGIGALGGTSAKIAQKVSGIEKGIARFCLQFGGKIGSEALEEGLQSILEPGISNWLLDTDKNVDWSEVAYSALLGGLTGGVFGVVDLSTEAVAGKLPSTAPKAAQVAASDWSTLGQPNAQTAVTQAVTARDPIQKTLDVVNSTVAQLNGDPANPLETAVTAFRENGTVSNKLADAISRSPDAVRTLVNEVGLRELPKTASEKRAAIKSAVEQFAQLQAERDAQLSTENEQSGVKEQLRNNQGTLNTMEPAAQISVPTEFSAMDKAGKQKWVVEKLRSTGYKVDRKGFGIIDFAKKRLKSAFKYFDSGSVEEATFEALPYVLEKGIEISSHSNHKGRTYRTVTIAAPVIINGKRGNMAVIVKQTDANHYKVHRILTPDGAVFNLSETTNEAARADGGVTENGSLATSNGAASLETGVIGDTASGHRQTQPLVPASNNSIPKTPTDVNPIVTEQGKSATPNESVGAADANFTGKQAVDTARNSQYDKLKMIEPKEEFRNGEHERAEGIFEGNHGEAYGSYEGMAEQGENPGRTRANESNRGGPRPLSRANGLSEQQLVEWAKTNAAVPAQGSAAEFALQSARDYGIPAYVVSGDAWESMMGDDPAGVKGASIFMSESIPEENREMIIPHEAVHIMRNVGYAPYMNLLRNTPDMVNNSSPHTMELMEEIAKHTGVDIFSIDPDSPGYQTALDRFFGEFNATVFGHVANGTVDNTAYDIRQIIPDFDSYVQQLKSINEGFKEWMKSGNRGQNTSVGAAPKGFNPVTALQYEHGTIDGGEKAVRPDDLPKSTDGKDRVSRFGVTAKGAKVTPDEFVDLLDKEVTGGRLSYMPITNDATTQAAMENIQKLGWEAALAQWQKDVHDEKTGPVRVATGALLLNNAAKAGDTKAWLDILHDYQSMTTNTAQAQQAQRILKTLSPDDSLYMIERSIQQIVEDTGHEVEVPTELFDEFTNAQSPEQRNEAIDKIQQTVADQLPSTLLERWNALRYVNMLGNFKTQIRNVSGNLAMKGVSGAKDIVATGLENLVNAVRKVAGKEGIQRAHTVVPVNKTLLASCKADFDNIKDFALGERKYGDTVSASDSFARGVQDKRAIFKTKPMEWYRKTTSTFMEKGDVRFSQSAYANALARYLQANGIKGGELSFVEQTNPALLDKARAYAIKQAQENTFRDNNTFSDAISKFGRHKDSAPWLKVLSEGIMPFRKTPANVAVRIEEYSPLGVVNAFWNTYKAAKGTGDVTTAIDSWAKSLTGSGLIALGAGLAYLGFLTAGDDEEDKEKNFDELHGYQAYSLKIGDYQYTVDWLSPAAVPLLIGAEIAQMEDLSADEIARVAGAATNVLVKTSMLQGLNDSIEAVKYSDIPLLAIAQNAAVSYFTQGITNTLLGQLERATESSRQTTYKDPNNPLDSWQYTIGKLSAKMPVVDFNQIPYIDAWGQEQENPGFLANLLYQTLSPGYISKMDKDDPVYQELKRVNEAKTVEKNVYPTRPDTEIPYTDQYGLKQTASLTSEEWINLAKKQGQTSRQVVENLIEHADYSILTDDQKAKAVSYVYAYAKNLAKDAVIEDYSSTESKWLQGIRSPEEAAETIIRYVATGTTELYTDLSIPKAANLATLLGGILPEPGHTNTRTIQKIEAVTGADSFLSEKEQKDVLEDILPNEAFDKYVEILAAGYSNDDFATAYRIDLDIEGEGAKEKTIRAFMKEFGTNRFTATKLYDLYHPKKET